MTELALTVAAVHAETPTIRRLTLVRTTGGALPPFEAGAHITLSVPGVGARKYSLVRTVSAAADPAPTAYVLGVRLEAQSAGGSRYVHQLAVGDAVVAEAPQNNFPLKAGSAPVALVAGGIGVTPLVSMAAELAAAGRAFSALYAVRNAAEMAFKVELEALAGGHLALHVDEAVGRVVDLAAHFASLPDGAQIYMCGPKPMLKAGMDAAKRLGWSRDRLAFELFYSVAAPNRPAAAAAPAAPLVSAALPASADGSFDVVLRSSGKTFRVPPDKTILDVLIENGEDPVHDCKRGECGVCQVGVVEGVPDHKDHILSEAERAANKVIQVCISRAKSPRLVLDL